MKIEFGVGLLLAGVASLAAVTAACSSSETSPGGTSDGAGGASSSHHASSTAQSTGNVLVTTGASSSSIASSASSSSHAASSSAHASSSSSSGAGGASCDVFTADSCGDCLEAKCCDAIIACEADPLCKGCIAGTTTSGCASDAKFEALASCEQTNCGAVIMQQSECCAPPVLVSDACHLPPNTWSCDPSLWDETANGRPNPICNCNCGDVRDPDCENNVPDDCGAGNVCSPCGCIPIDSGCQ